ncbi:MAG: ABC transporter ATP-binding protein [Spirochaetaceae bacterium]|jgi:iron complex transport system ATP-binding protein|nr:ABC transporter ATP-binding protein [Spirochaetaceae bacterium]
MSISNSVLRTDKLSAGYNGKAVIENIDINALKGQIICLLGPNGAGKSTILRTLSGLLAPVKGAVYIGNQNIEAINAQDRAKRLAVVLTERLNIPQASAYDIVCAGRAPHTGYFGKISPADRMKVEECMEITGARSIAQRIYADLSDGEKQKVMIARALAQDPELIILDEPTSHLDIRHKIEVIRILRRLSQEQGLTVILALHDIEIAIKACEFLMLVKNGKITACGRSEDIINENTINDLYGIEGAFFNFVLGSTEIFNTNKSTVFVAAGAGTGSPLYRALSRNALGITTGILHKNDVDYYIASSMKIAAIAENSFAPIGDALYNKALDEVSAADFIIDAGFPVAEINCRNIDLLKYAAEKEKICFTMRTENDINNLFKDCAKHFIKMDSYSGIAEKILSLKNGASL